LLSLDAIADYETGCQVLGSGGGGAPVPITIALAELLRSRSLPLLDTLADDAQISAVGAVGGPSVFAERLPSGNEYQVAEDLLVRIGMPAPTAIVSFETAGMNGAYAAWVAALEGLPLVDGDLMGRALPKLEQASLAVSTPISPAVLVSPTGDALLVESDSAESVERVVRAALPGFGGWGLFVTRPFRADELRGQIVTGTISRAVVLGRAVRRLPQLARGEEIARAVDGKLLGSGSVAEVLRHPRDGAFGSGSLYLIDTRSGSVVRVEYQNEYLLAAVDGRVVVTCPDLLVIVDPRLHRLISAEDVRPGMDVAVVAAEGPAWWKASAERLARVSPRAFGLAQDPIPWEAT